MFRNYLAVAWRNLKRQKVYAGINILGLALGLACSLLILLWIVDEHKFNQFLVDGDLVFQVIEDQTYANGQQLTTQSTMGPLAPALLEERPEIHQATRVSWGDADRYFANDDDSFIIETTNVELSYFDIFEIEFIEGDAENAFPSLESIVISDKMAKAMFGDEPALGKTLQRLNRSEVVVSGVFKSRGKLFSIESEGYLPYESWVQRHQWARTSWGNNSLRTYIKLHEGQDWEQLSAEIRGLVKTKQEGTPVELFLYPFKDLYLKNDITIENRGGGRIEYVRIFGLVSVFVLLIACINFMNLATARSARRSREIGVRKAVGARKGLLIGQFLMESLLVSAIAMGIALVLVGLSIPYFNEITSKEMYLPVGELWLWGLILGITLLAGLLAGSYPALYMASFDAVSMLKGVFKSGKAAVSMRHGLVVFQFAMSVILIICTVFVYRQMDYMLNKDLGFEKEHLVYFSTFGELPASKFQAFQNEVIEVPGIVSMTRTNSNPLNVGSSTGDVRWEGMTAEQGGLFSILESDYDFTETTGVRIAEGRSFDRSFGSDSAMVLINRQAAQKMGMTDPVGQKVSFWDTDFTIIGMTEDFHTSSLKYGHDPLIVIFRPENTWMTLLRLDGRNTSESLDRVQEIYKQHTRSTASFKFMDEYYASNYQRESTISTLARWFSGFAMVISCLGLLGLAMFTAELRTKEVGVRKVLGASVSNLVMLLTSTFTKLVIVAFVIAAPVAWFLVDRWLDGFAFRITPDMWTFVATGAVILITAWVTVLWQCLKAALVNPADVLKYE